MVSVSPFVGTAGWSIPRRHAEDFAGGGSHLERYARMFNGTEINSSFHRPHRPSTYERWAASVPDAFRFSVKLPRAITHERRLENVAEMLEAFLAQAAGLGPKLGPVLVQLPPSLAFEARAAGGFVATLRQRFSGDVVCEPRHASWFTGEAEALLVEGRIGRVAADPARVPEAGRPGGSPCLVYYRLHGSPRPYYSSYAPEDLEALALRVAAHARRGVAVWCILDNTAGLAATANAMTLARQVAAARASRG